MKLTKPEILDVDIKEEDIIRDYKNKKYNIGKFVYDKKNDEFKIKSKYTEDLVCLFGGAMAHEYYSLNDLMTHLPKYSLRYSGSSSVKPHLSISSSKYACQAGFN